MERLAYSKVLKVLNNVKFLLFRYFLLTIMIFDPLMIQKILSTSPLSRIANQSSSNKVFCIFTHFVELLAREF